MAPVESFLVEQGTGDTLLPGERERTIQWARVVIDRAEQSRDLPGAV